MSDPKCSKALLSRDSLIRRTTLLEFRYIPHGTAAAEPQPVFQAQEYHMVFLTILLSRPLLRVKCTLLRIRMKHSSDLRNLQADSCDILND